MNSMRVAAFLKDNSWVLNGAFTIIGTYFIAGAANAFVAKQIRVIPTIEDAASMPEMPETAAPPPEYDVTFASIAERNLMGATRENLDAAAATSAEDAIPEANPNDLRPCTINGSLRATLVADTPEWSVAIIFNTSTQESQAFSINAGSNEIADDATLVEIRSREIVVRRRDHFELCAGEGEQQENKAAGGPAVAVAPAATDGAPADPAADDMTGVTKVSDTQYNIERSEIDKALNNLNQVATQARIVPSFKNGKANGFKLFSIKAGSIYSKIGLKNGDVIQKINGYDMNSPDKALEVYQKLRDAQNVQIELTRRGQNMSMSYGIQ